MLPTANMHVLGSIVRFYRDHGVRGLMFQGAFSSPGGERFPMRVWVMAKLFWGPSRDVNELQQDFIWGFYGKAAPAIADYYVLLEDPKMMAAPLLAPGGAGPDYKIIPEDRALEFLKKATAVYNRAEKLAENELVRRRAELARLPIMYVKLERGPGFVAQLGEDYPSLIDRFEKIGGREGTTHVNHWGGFKQKLAKWRNAWRAYSTAPATGKE